MNKNAKEWVKALRSGKYKQAPSYLRSDQGFCCLGVACDLYAKKHKSVKWKVGTKLDDSGRKVYSFSGEGCTLPVKVMRWLNLGDPIGAVGDTSLTHLNDKEYKSFSQIADFIEERENDLFARN